MIYYFEIKNTKTGDTYQGYGSGMRSIALQAGWKLKDCKSIYRAPALQCPAPKLGLDNLEAMRYNKRKRR